VTYDPDLHPRHGYRHLVEVDGPSETRRRYDGRSDAEALAAWQAAISEGIEYVTLESLHDREVRP
jgi:hypothetical protein